MPYALREALAAFRRSPMLAGLSIAMIALSLLVVGLFGIAAFNIRRVLDRVAARNGPRRPLHPHRRPLRRFAVRH